MTIARILRRATQKHRLAHLAVVVLPNESTAFQAYRLLQYHGISPENLAIVGEGYSCPERVGIKQPLQIAWSKARSLGIGAALLGSLLGLCAAWLGQLAGNWFAIGAIAGIMSGFCGAVVGGLIGYLGEGSAASIYRHHLNQGRYLLMMEGPETLVRWGQEVLSHYSAPSPH